MRRARLVVAVVLLAAVVAGVLLHSSRPRHLNSASNVVASAVIHFARTEDGVADSTSPMRISPHLRAPSNQDLAIAEYRREATCRHFRQILPFTGDRNQLAKDYLADDNNFATAERREHTNGVMDALEANQAFVDAHSADCADATPLPDATFFEDAFAAASAGDVDAGNCWLSYRLTSEPETALADPAFQSLLQIGFEHGDWAIVDTLESRVRKHVTQPAAVGGVPQGIWSHPDPSHSDPIREYRFARLGRYGVDDAERGRTFDELLEMQRAAFDPKVADEADAWAANTFHRWFEHRATTRSQCPAQ
jgi:hypothetical protein